MAICVQCGREYSSDAPQGMCGSCAQDGKQQGVDAVQQEFERLAIAERYGQIERLLESLDEDYRRTILRSLVLRVLEHEEFYVLKKMFPAEQSLSEVSLWRTYGSLLDSIWQDPEVKDATRRFVELELRRCEHPSYDHVLSGGISVSLSLVEKTGLAQDTQIQERFLSLVRFLLHDDAPKHVGYDTRLGFVEQIVRVVPLSFEQDTTDSPLEMERSRIAEFLAKRTFDIIKDFPSIISAFHLGELLREDKRVQNSLHTAMSEIISNWSGLAETEVHDFLHILSALQYPEEERSSILRKGLIENTFHIVASEGFIKIAGAFGIPIDDRLVTAGILHSPENYDIYKPFLKDMHPDEDSDLDEDEKAIINFFLDASVPENIKQADETHDVIKDFFKYVKDNDTEDFPTIEWTSFEQQKKVSLRELLQSRSTHMIAPREYLHLLYDSRGLEIVHEWRIHDWSETKVGESHAVEGYKLAHDIREGDPKDPDIREKIAQWRLKYLEQGWNEQLARPYALLYKAVGGDTLLKFLNKPDLSLHDALQCDHGLEDYVFTNWPWDGEPSVGLKDPEFANMARGVFRDLMMQVAKDNAEYKGGSAYFEFGRVLRIMNGTSIQDVLNRATAVPIPGLAERVVRLREPKFDPRRTWAGLKAIAGIKEILERTELLDAKYLSPKMSVFVAGLLESPIISTDAVTDFVDTPENFLNRPARYVDEHQQYMFSPARFAEVERTGLTHAMVRDALIDGTLDRLQLLPPHEETYQMTDNGGLVTDTRFVSERLVDALGKRSKGIEGKARDVKGLFHRVQQWVLRYVKVSDTDEPMTPNGAAAIVRKWVKSGDAPNVSTDAMLELAGTGGILYENQMGIDAPSIHTVRVRVGAKSDPSLRASAESVANCMPFGDGKTNTFDWNPAIAQLVVERLSADGTWKAMAQSVLMIDHELQADSDGHERNASNIINSLRAGRHTVDVLKEEDLVRPRVLVADNIEPNLNELDVGRAPVIESAYRLFGGAYLKQLPDGLFMDRSRFIVGKEGYPTGRKDWNFPKVSNTFVPGSPVSYMDSVGEEVYEIAHKDADASEPPKGTIVDIDASHVLAMSFLEGKGFSENKSLVFGLADRHQRILATTIARERFNDPSFTFMTRNDRGIVEGYMLARVNHARPETPEVYIDDIAVNRKRGVASARYAMRLIDTFVERYMERYVQGDEPMPPLYAEMRETTSYQLVTRKLDSLARKGGQSVHYKLVELGEGNFGGETFKRVRIFLGRTQEELEEQILRYESIRPEDLIASPELEKMTDTEGGTDDWNHDEDDAWDDGGDYEYDNDEGNE